MTDCAGSSRRAGLPPRSGRLPHGFVPRRKGGRLGGWPLFVAAGVLGCLLILACGGCASRARVVPVPIQKPPAEEVRLEPRDGADSDVRAAPLPGAERVYPSQDPRNQTVPGAPVAFPESPAAPSGAKVPPQPEIPSPEATAPSAVSPPDGAVAPPGETNRSSGPSAGSAPALAEEGFSVQLFATNSRVAADQRATDLRRYFELAPRVTAEGGLFKVRLGPYAERDAAENVRRRAFDLGFRDAFVVAPAAARPAGER